MGTGQSVQPEKLTLDGFTARVDIKCSPAELDGPVEPGRLRLVLDGASAVTRITLESAWALSQSSRRSRWRVSARSDGAEPSPPGAEPATRAPPTRDARTNPEMVVPDRLTPGFDRRRAAGLPGEWRTIGTRTLACQRTNESIPTRWGARPGRAREPRSRSLGEPCGHGGRRPSSPG